MFLFLDLCNDFYIHTRLTVCIPIRYMTCMYFENDCLFCNKCYFYLLFNLLNFFKRFGFLMFESWIESLELATDEKGVD